MAKSIVYNEDIINEVNKRLNQLGEKSKDCSKKMVSNYSGLTSHGMLTETVGDLDKNFGSFQSVVSGTANSFLKHGTEMIDFDRKAALEIEGTQIPQDFVGNNSIEINYYNASILSKIDGKSTNDGKKSTEEKEYDDGTVVAAENLFDMSKKPNTNEKEYDDTTVIGKSILGGVKGGQTNQKEVDDSTSIGNVNLRSVNGGVTSQQSYDGSVSVNNVNLGGVNGGNTVSQDFDESTVIGESILGNINSNKKANSEKSIDDILAALDEKKEMYDEQKASTEEVKKEE